MFGGFHTSVDWFQPILTNIYLNTFTFPLKIREPSQSMQVGIPRIREGDKYLVRNTVTKTKIQHFVSSRVKSSNSTCQHV